VGSPTDPLVVENSVHRSRGLDDGSLALACSTAGCVARRPAIRA